MSLYKVILDKEEIIEFETLNKSIKYCKINTQYKNYIIICSELQYSLIGERISDTHIDWVNSDIFKV